LNASKDVDGYDIEISVRPAKAEFDSLMLSAAKVSPQDIFQRKTIENSQNQKKKTQRFKGWV
jgi:hypothetical protein